MIIQKQQWHEFIRYILFTDDGEGSVQVEIDNERRDADIYALWVNPTARRKGLATELLKSAEEIARKAKCTAITLYWDMRDTPRSILNWYIRNGYKETDSFGDFRVWLRKKIK